MEKFTGIASKDLSFKPGKEFEMIEKVRKKLGKTAKELLTIIIEF